MNKLVRDLQLACFYGEPIEDMVPYDLTGYRLEDVREILYIYEKYGGDPERVRLCKIKRKELKDAGRRYRL